MPNRLASETSPYLLQHKDNPVDWYPWGPEALERARREDKPILLSIGYSSCHWCHVMERESFENAETASLMNELFVNIKVDREERPDLDAVYMEAVQAMTGHGGWPMTVFLTPDTRPYYAGTYYPPADRHGMPGFPRVLTAAAEAYHEHRDAVLQTADEIQSHLSAAARLDLPASDVTVLVLDQALARLSQGFDRQHGGFGGAPKFPQPMLLEFLLRSHVRTGSEHALQMVRATLDAMAYGGIRDHLGGGFHRYSVDEHWLVPHFEKMLYDNALLPPVYLHAWQITGESRYRAVVEETLDFILREMTSPEGGFYSAQDADTEGEEGATYVWTPEEVAAVLPERDAELFVRYYDVTPSGNFEGRSILHTMHPLEDVAAELGMPAEEAAESIARSRSALLAARSQRPQPGRDDKVLTAWNGLMLAAVAEAGAVLGRADYLHSAVRNAELILSRLRTRGGLLRSYKDGRAHTPGYLEDYAFDAYGLITLYQATHEAQWLMRARELTDEMITQFWDDSLPGFYDTGEQHESLMTRPRNLYDNAIPSGTSVACDVLLRLAGYFAELSYEDTAAAVLRSMAPAMQSYPTAVGRLLCAADFYVSTPVEIAVIGHAGSADADAMLSEVHSRYLPNSLLAVGMPDSDASALIPLLADRPQLDGTATAYVCRNYVCERPVTTVDALREQLTRFPART